MTTAVRDGRRMIGAYVLHENDLLDSRPQDVDVGALQRTLRDQGQVLAL